MVASVQAYHEAIRLSESRLRITDPEIKQGAPEWVEVSAGKQTYTQPWAQNGSYAVVYRYRLPSGERKALRCYRVAMQEEIKERYARLAEYFREHLPGISAGFRFFEEGILVEDRGQLAVRQVVLMDWIEGQTLLTWLDALCQARDREGIGALTRRWEALVEVLWRAQVAHGDLSGSNILVREDGQIILVDYDGVYIPDFAGKTALVSGVPDYQHPQRQDRPFNALSDAFSLAVIVTALRALYLNPSLWDDYAPHSSNGTLKEDRLLFSVHDFEDPDASPLFRELEEIPDPLLYALVSQLKEACSQSVVELLPPP